MKKKLSFSLVRVSDTLLEECFAKHEEQTGMQREYISKQTIVNLILSKYVKEGK
jgi:hypothetical protein